MNRSRPSLQKRQREKAKREKHQQKQARKAETKDKKSGLEDLSHIVPGPQPKPWDDGDEAERGEDEQE
jgi:hypothetical protein